MKIHGLSLDPSPIIAEDKSLKHARNITVNNDLQSYSNELGFKDIGNINDINITDNTNVISDDTDICGIILTNIGFVVFSKSKNTDYSYIQYYVNENDTLNLQKTIRSLYLNFDINRPITGDYTYNYKKDLIVTFTEGTAKDANETRIINITNPINDSDEDKSFYELNENETTLLNIIPDVIYPTLNFTIENDGNLKTGAYQIAIKYKLPDGTYTNYSVLHRALIVAGEYEEDFEVGISISKSIVVEFTKVDPKYNYYRLAIVYKDDSGDLAYETDDLKIQDENSFIISNLESYSSITLEDILVNKISYIKDVTHVNFNNRLIRANVQGVDYSDINDSLIEVANEMKVGLELISKESVLGKNIKYFKAGEIYSIYAGFYDYKGNLVNIYKIPHKDTDETLDFNTNHKIPLTSSEIPDWINGSNTIIKNEESDLYSRHIAIYPEYKNTQIKGDGYTIELEDYTEPENPSYKKLLKFKSDTPNKNIRLYLRYTPNFTPLSSGYIESVMTLYERTSEGEFVVLDKKTNSITYPNNEIYYEYRFVTDDNSEKTLAINYDFISDTEITYPEDYFNVEFYGLNNDGIGTNVQTFTQLNINIPQSVIDKVPKIIKGYSIFTVEHNFNNSRILSQCLALRDIETNNFANSQTYKGQFQAKNKYRLYPFEFLFNKKTNISCKVVRRSYLSGYPNISNGFNNETVYKISKEYVTKAQQHEQQNPLWNQEVFLTEGLNVENNWIYKAAITVSDIYSQTVNINDDEPNNTIHQLQYILNNNTQVSNIAGESHYRFEPVNNQSIMGVRDRMSIVELINVSNNLYVDEYNQKLEINSSISPIVTNPIRCYGDTFYSYITLRATCPDYDFISGDTQKQERDSNAYVWRWVITYPVESKFNINARYSKDTVNKSFKLHGKRNAESLLPILAINYQIDNYINTEVGKGYSVIYNENGIQEYIYSEDIKGITQHINRIIRSDVFTSESEIINWRYFNADEYKDMPNNRGAIVSLKTDNKNLYIQQEYGLRLAFLKDTLSNTDEGSSYLGTADLFDREPIELMYSPSGYIGCTSQFDTTINIAGYFVCDNKRGKIFQAYGSEVKELSSINCKAWFETNINKSSENNPFIKNGRYFNFNEKNNTLFFVHQQDKPFTISLHGEITKWISFHDYIPTYGINNRNNSLWFNRDENDITKSYAVIDELYGKFLNGKTFDSIFVFTFNAKTAINKLLNAIIWKDLVSIFKNGNCVYQWEDTISEIGVYNEDQASGLLDVKFNKTWYNGNTGVNKINIWRFNNLNDIAKNNEFLLNDYTFDITKLKKNPKWYQINKFISQFIYAIMKFDNKNNNRRYELDECDAEWRIDNRNKQS